MKDFLSIFEDLSELNSEVTELATKNLTESYKLTEAATDSDEEDTEEVLEQDETEVEAEDEEVEDEAPAQLVLECSKCGALVIKDEADVKIDSETDLANVEDSCEFCEEANGYKVLGALTPHEFADEIEIVDDEADETDAEESAEATPEEEGLAEAAFSGGYASDRGAVDRWARPGGSIHQGKYEVYLTNLASRYPDIVKIITIKAKDIKPGMITQAGEVKEAEMRRTNKGDTQMYIMHTNNWDGFWEAEADMEVMANPEDDSTPFIGNYQALRDLGIREGLFDFGKKKREKEEAARKVAEEEEKARAEAKKKRDELQRLYDRADVDNQRDTWRQEQEARDARRAYERKRYDEISSSKVSNTGKSGVYYSGGDYYSEDFDADVDDRELDELFNLIDVNLDARGFGGSGNDVSVL